MQHPSTECTVDNGEEILADDGIDQKEERRCLRRNERGASRVRYKENLNSPHAIKVLVMLRVDAHARARNNGYKRDYARTAGRADHRGGCVVAQSGP